MNEILDWLEVLAPLIPIYFYIIKRPRENYLAIVAAYLLTALCINAISDVSWKFNSCMPLVLKQNTFLYNINSIVRVFYFVLFFKYVIKPEHKNIYKITFILYILCCVIDFYLEDFYYLSSFLHSMEAIGLLTLCILYFIRLIRSDEVFLSFDPYLIIVAGLAIYESVNFFVFLFFKYLTANDPGFASALWKVPNIVFFVFCLFITRSFYGRYSKQ